MSIGPSEVYQSSDWVNRCLPKEKAGTNRAGKFIGAVFGKMAIGALYATGAVIALELMGYL